MKPFAEPGTYGCIPLWACDPRNIIILPTNQICLVERKHDESYITVLNLDIQAEMIIHKNIKVINLTFLMERLDNIQEIILGHS